MRAPTLLILETVDAACRLHEQLSEWKLADDALSAVKEGVQGFAPHATLAKVAIVNALYYTNAFAIGRIAAHFTAILTDSQRLPEGPILVETLAKVPKGGSEKRPKMRLSLASKFAHFFIDPERHPIYDQYAIRMVAHHRPVSEGSLRSSYARFVHEFDALARQVGISDNRRRLDRYLWLQGQYERWASTGNATNKGLQAKFDAGA